MTNLSRLLARPSAAASLLAVVAIAMAGLALVFSTSGFVAAAPSPPTAKDEVQVLTTATGSLAVTAPEGNQEYVTLPLQHATYTVKPGTTVLLIANLTSPDIYAISPAVADCSADVVFSRNPADTAEFPWTLTIPNYSEWHGRSVYAYTAPATSQTETLAASVWARCAASPYPSPAPGWTVNLELEVLGLK